MKNQYYGYDTNNYSSYDMGCGCDNDYGFGERDCGCCKGKMEIEKILRKNIGRVVNIYTEVMGDFTGLVTRVDDSTVKLTTSIPSAPFERNRFESRIEGNCDLDICKHCRNSHFGSAVIIPICKIVAVSVVEI